MRGTPMHGMGGNCCGAGRRPLFPGIMALQPADEVERQRLLSEADARIHQGLAGIQRASAEIEHVTTPRQRELALAQMREGISFYESGLSAREALSRSRPSPVVALDWFRSSLNLPPLDARHGAAADWFGFSPAHLLFMTILLLVAASLLALEALRLKRVRDLVRAATAKRPPGALPPAPGATSKTGAAPTSAPRVAGAPGDTGLRSGLRGGLPRSVWSGDLRVAQIVPETPTVETFRLVNPAHDRLPFEFLPGQFIQVEVEPEPGKSARRSYTIASSPTQRAYVEITVKREVQGLVSRHLHDRVKVGDLIKVSGPFGSFTFTGSDADSIVLIAGGVGITPMMSVLRYLTDTAWPGEIFFVYGARSTEEFIFRTEIEQLERRHEKLHVLATMQRSPGTVWLGPEGQLTKELLQAGIPEIARRRIHLCGPPQMMSAVRGLLRELGVPEAQIHSEAFGPASLPPDNAPVAESGATEASPPPPPVAPARKEPVGVAATTITFSISGVSGPLPADQTVLEAAEEAGVEIPYSCRVGICGVCVTRLLEGEVSMAVETGLDPADKAQGFVLACQAKCTRGPLVVEA
jgi:ferredoxin-NADP reductase